MTHPAHTRRPIYEIRWRNFRRLLVEHRLTLTKAATDLMGKQQGQVSAFGGKNPTKIIGDDVAEDIEAAFGLRPGDLDYINCSVPESPDGPSSTRFTEADAVMLVEADRWVMFEEKGLGKFQPLRRAQRLLALYELIRADGGALSPDHAQEIIDTVRARGEHGNKPS